MLRAFVITIGAVLTCVGVALVAVGVRQPGWQAVGVGLVLLVGTLFERWRYQHTEQRPEGQWKTTGERFLDPTTGDSVEVLFDPRTGDRRYVSTKSELGSDPPP